MSRQVWAALLVASIAAIVPRPVAVAVLVAVGRGQVIELVTDIPPVVRDAVPAVLDLFDEYSIVALSEGPHNNQKGHQFRLALVRDPRFGRLVDDVVVEVDDVVVEFGNSRDAVLHLGGPCNSSDTRYRRRQEVRIRPRS